MATRKKAPKPKKKTTAGKKRMKKKRVPSKRAGVGEDLELIHFLICDEVRPEAKTNKMIYLGVYAKTIVVAEDGQPMDRLTFVFSIHYKSGKAPKKAEFKAVDPRGKMSLGPFKFDAPPHPSGNDSVTLFVVARSLPLFSGEYQVTLTLDGTLSFTRTFFVRADPNFLARYGGRQES